MMMSSLGRMGHNIALVIFKFWADSMHHDYDNAGSISHRQHLDVVLHLIQRRVRAATTSVDSTNIVFSRS